MSDANIPFPILESTPSDDATPLQHFATSVQHNATLCNIRATPQPILLSPLNHDQISTCVFPPSAPCNTCDIETPLAGAVSGLNHATINSYDLAASSAAPVTCCTNHPLLHLTPIQHRALDLLHAGQSVTATARALNLHRVTVYRWKTRHPRFIAELAHRAALSHVDTSLKAHRALDVAMNIILKSLASGSPDARQTALRLIASPRLARLATTSTSASLRQTLSQFQQLRTIDAPADTPADAALMDDLLTELDAPIPTDSQEEPKPSKPLRHMAERPTRTLPWAPSAKPPLSEVLANRPPRPEILAALKQYGCTPEQSDIPARRPDITPFDVHCLALTMGPQPHRIGVLTNDDGIHIPIFGVDSPLNPNVLAEMISRGLVTRLAGHNLAGYTPANNADAKTLTLSHPTKPTITIPHNHLWRDSVIPA